ncbi:unnamed protein product [Macrosiphum euphorbiae]|uniref:THAP-type domain-containing protein n=1 Tax=Macrosiphum euphorbiae TaxID=13131 RepID=A0AAV0XV97_9HEMI|nr:unnamed protein product [Macrosiphum euphorbiae]
MVKRCVICGIVDAIVGVSVHNLPTDVVRQRLWVQFIENQGFQVNRTSKLCSRHFIPHVDFAPGNLLRRHLTKTAVPSIVVRAQPVPDRELPVHAEIDNADARGCAEMVEVQMEDIEEEVIQMDQVLMNDDNAEMVEVEYVAVQMEDIDEEIDQMDQVMMNDDNVEFIEVRMDEVLMDVDEVVPGEILDNNEGMQLEIEMLHQGVDEEVSEYFFILLISMFVKIL